MSPAELVRYGRVMLAMRPCVMGGFRWDTDYLAKPGVRSAVDSLARLAQRQPKDCA